MMVLAKIYSVSSTYFTSICGGDVLGCDALLPSQENQFSKDNLLSLTVNIDAQDLSSKTCDHQFNVRCRYFTYDEITKLEAGFNQEELTNNAVSDVRYLHFIMIEEEVTRIGLRSGQIVNVEAIPTKLTRIILTAKYDKGIIKEPGFLMNNSKYLKCDEKDVYVGKKIVKDVCHQGNVINIELEAMKCEPVSQGIADENTKWIILDSSCDSHGSMKYLKNGCNADITTADMLGVCDTKIHLNKQSLLIAGFASPLKELWCDNQQDSTVQFKTEVDYWHTLHHSFVNSSTNRWRLDENDNHCLYVSMETLMELGVQNGCLVKVWIQGVSAIEMSESNGKLSTLDTLQTSKEKDGDNCIARSNDTLSYKTAYHHYAQVFAIHPTFKALDIYLPEKQHFHVFSMEEYIKKTRKTVHISPLLLFNLLHEGASASSELYMNLTVETKMAALPNNSNTIGIPFAQDAHLSLINTPYTKPGDSFDNSLKRYFAKPRLLTVDDILCVNFDITKDEVDSLMTDECYGLSTIYFKVKKLVVAGKDETSCLVDMGHTTVYQSTSVHSFVPVDVESQHDKSNYWMSTSPPGLHKPTNELISIIKPYLKKHVNLMPAVLLTGPGGVGKRTIINAVSRQLGLCVMNINCYDLIGESIAATESRINNVFQKATDCRPCLLLLRNVNILVKDRDGLEDEPRVANTLQQCITSLKDITSWPVVVIATSSSTTPLSAQLYSCFLHEVKIQAPTEYERKEILEALASMGSVAHDVSFSLVAKRTAGLVLADLVALFTKAANTALEQASKQSLRDIQNEEHSIICIKEGADQRVNSTVNQVDSRIAVEEGRTLGQSCNPAINQEDFEKAIEILRAEHSDAIGAPKIPNVSWQDIGGLLDVKEELLDTIQLPLQHPELFASGLRRSGVLLYGPPGTGKTLLAKAVATECSLNFLSVKGPELINMYVGQSEQNVRQVFSRAQSATPCVIFFDELDSLAPNRGRSGDSGGVMDRVVSQLLAELDGLHKSCDVFVIGATNRPDLLDPAILRPGRFDKLLYLGISEDHETQLKILKALTKKFDLDVNCSLEAISHHCPLSFTGADLYALCSDAMLYAIKRAIAQQSDVASEVQPSVQVKDEDFLEALCYLTPSVPEQELQRYKQIQNQLRT